VTSLIVLFLLSLPSSPDAGSTNIDLKKPIDTLRQSGGQSTAQDRQAWLELTRAEPARLPELLAGMDGATPVARNWIRSAVDPVIERARAKKTSLPFAELEHFLADRRHDPQARRFAYDLIVEADPKSPDRLLPGMLDDPSPELRHEAIARLLSEAEKIASSPKKSDAIPLFQKCLTFTREKEQIDKAARKLKELGRPVDLARQYGFVLEWKLIGPFPNPEDKGIDTSYPPEKGIDLAAECDGKAGKVRWRGFATTSELGVVDLQAAIGKEKAGVAYALTEFTSEREQPVEIRMGSITATKLWVNDELVMARYDAFTGVRIDSYVARAHLKAGKNVFLIKSAKDAPPEPRLDKWWFQLRVCDGSGAAILSTTRPKTPDKTPDTKS
jgi:hypothetical protein